MLIVSYGGGTNSTAMLVGMKERGIRPDHITMADTGGEQAHTYAHLEIMQEWCKKNNFPEIIIVKKVDKNGDVMTLEENCLDRKCLPSLAYGWKTCSQKFKAQPQDKYFNNLPEAKAVWKSGKKITKCIGFDLGEDRRAKEYEDKKYLTWYPLIEWEWDRDDCIEAIKREGLSLPGKSSCFFCPASTKPEIRSLAVTHPDLMKRAIAMERNAELTSVKGLGRRFNWEDLIATDDLFPENFIEMACGCYDGG